MSNTASPAGTAPAPEPTPAAAPTAEQLSSAIPTFTTDQLDELLEASPAAAPAPAAPAAAPAAAAPAEGAPAPAAPAKTEGDAEPEDGEHITSIKVKPNDYREQEVLRLMKPRDGSPALTLQQAYARVYGEADGKPAEAKKDEPPADPTAPIVAEITAAETALADLEKQIAKASEDMDLAAVTKLTREAVRAEQKIQSLRDKVEATKQSAEQAATQSFRQIQANYTKQAVELYPALRDTANADRKEFDAFIAAKYNDPEFQGIFESPRWPLIMAKEFAESKGWTPASKSTAPAPAAAPAAPAPKQPTPVAPSAARATAAAVVAPGAPGEGSTFTPTKETLMANVDKLSAKELDALLAKPTA